MFWTREAIQQQQLNEPTLKIIFQTFSSDEDLTILLQDGGQHIRPATKHQKRRTQLHRCPGLFKVQTKHLPKA